MTDDAAAGPLAAPRHARRAAPGPEVEEATRTAGMLIHGFLAVIAVLSVGTLGFVTALLIFLLVKDRSDFMRSHAANALNVQIMTGFGLFVAVFLSILGMTAPLVAAAVILATSVTIHTMGALHARRGEEWSPPLTPRMVR